MKLALSSLIAEIDKYAATVIGTPIVDLMAKSGAAVDRTVRKNAPEGSSVIILAGKGNNGGDGYAAAVRLMDSYRVRVYDVFSSGQRTDEGKYFLSLFKDKGGEVIDLTLSEEQKDDIRSAACIVDAVFGTGFRGEIPELVKELATTVSEAVGARKIAVDVPMGVNADDGSVDISAASWHATVELSFIKPGIVSYPARSFVGEIVYDDLGLPRAEIEKNFDFRYHLIDAEYAKKALPKRESNSNKGTFGKALLITGSERYRGAGRLSLEAALRGGAGYVTYLGTRTLADEFSRDFPEAIYKSVVSFDESGRAEAMKLSRSHTSVLVGSGSGNTEELLLLVRELLTEEGAPVVLDADAINVLASLENVKTVIKDAKRPVVLTPHPLEFARLSGDDVASVQRKRLGLAIRFAAENRCILVLKGAGTIVTDGKQAFINASGSSALAKAGSGDVLAGFIASLLAQGIEPLCAAALGVYYHGAAGDSLAKEYSTYGVTPSDLPREIARMIAKTQKQKGEK